MNDQQTRIDISKLDLTKQTITLCDDDGEPLLCLMKGHVDAETYVVANHAEGWGNDGTVFTDEQIKIQARDEASHLQHNYGKFDVEKNTWIDIDLEKEAEGAEPITVRWN